MKYRVKRIDINGDPIVIMNYSDALRENIPPSKRARVINDGRTVYVMVEQYMYMYLSQRLWFLQDMLL